MEGLIKTQENFKAKEKKLETAKPDAKDPFHLDKNELVWGTVSFLNHHYNQTK